MVTTEQSRATEAILADFPPGPPATPRDIPFFQDPMIDHLLRGMVTLAMELSVTRDRLRSIELVLARDARDMSREIEQLSLSPAEDEKRRTERERLIGSILRPFLSVQTPPDGNS